MSTICSHSSPIASHFYPYRRQATINFCRSNFSWTSSFPASCTCKPQGKFEALPSWFVSRFTLIDALVSSLPGFAHFSLCTRTVWYCFLWTFVALPVHTVCRPSPPNLVLLCCSFFYTLLSAFRYFLTIQCFVNGIYFLLSLNQVILLTPRTVVRFRSHLSFRNYSWLLSAASVDSDLVFPLAI